jgi:predicted enzyme related to lactoylglutathione lyase
MPTIQGRSAIRNFYGNVFRSLQASDAVPDRIRVSAGGDMAWSSGQVSNAFASTDGSDEGPVAYTGRYLLVWERRGEEWFIVVYSLIQQPGEDTMGTRERVTGIGGVFFRSRDPAALAAWYREHLGVPVEEGQTYGMFTSAGSGESTVWSAFPEDTDYFGPGSRAWMVNYRVRDLDAMLAQLRAAGVEVLDRTETYDFGKFGWALDPEGNRFELWEPTM